MEMKINKDRVSSQCEEDTRKLTRVSHSPRHYINNIIIYVTPVVTGVEVGVAWADTKAGCEYSEISTLYPGCIYVSR